MAKASPTPSGVTAGDIPQLLFNSEYTGIIIIVIGVIVLLIAHKRKSKALAIVGIIIAIIGAFRLAP